MADSEKKQVAAFPTYDLKRILNSVEAQSKNFSAEEWELFAQFCSRWLLTQIGMLDARWKRLIDAAKIETHRDDWKLLGSWVAKILEKGEHLSSVAHPYFQEGGGRIVEKKCERDGCDVRFMPAYSGQRFHDDRCGSLYFKQQQGRAA